MKQNSILGVSEEGFHHIAYTEWGSYCNEHPSIICVHGLTRNGRDFDGLASYFALQDRHVFCPDVVGRGESSWFKNPQHYNFTQYVMDMNALIARTGAKSIDWVGTSMGGIIGMMIAALPNSPIHKLILNDVGPQIPLYGLRQIAKSIGNVPRFKSLEEAQHHFQTSYAEFGPLTDEQWHNFTLHSVEKRGPNSYMAKVDPAIRNPKSTFQVISEFFHHPHKALEGIVYDIDLWSIWEKIHCPVLVIHGVHSHLLTEDIIKKMCRTHPETYVFNIEDAGHAPALMDPLQQEFIYNWLE